MRLGTQVCPVPKFMSFNLLNLASNVVVKIGFVLTLVLTWLYIDIDTSTQPFINIVTTEC